MSQPVCASKNGIRVLVGDRNRLHAELLVAALTRQRGFSVLGYSGTSDRVLKAIQETEPDIVVIGANLQDGPGTGLQIVQQLRSISPAMRCVVLLEESERDQVIAAFRAGAMGVFFQSQSAEALPKCVLSVHQGQVWANTRELHFILQALTESGSLKIVDARGMRLLTKREEQVVSLLNSGLTNREIAQRLQLSEHTVKNYFCHIYEKLGISNRVELLLYSVRATHLKAALLGLLIPALARVPDGVFTWLC